MLQIIKKYKFYVLSSLIVLLAILLRFPFLSVYPPSMVQDEVGIGYAAISIAETGKDEWGNSFPLIFKSFGDYKAPLHIYTTAILYKIIGWHEVLPRVASAIQGTFVVLIGLFWIRKLFKSDHLGLIGGLILAVSPWTIHISRMGFEINYGLALFMAGLLFMSYAKESKFKLALSALFFGLSTYTYHSYRYSVLLFLISIIIAIVILNFKNIKKYYADLKNISIILIVSLFISLPGFMAKNTTGRLSQTLIVTSDNYTRLYEHYENNCHGTLIEINPKLSSICRIKYNKFTRPILIGIDSYTDFLSPEFLFFSGDKEVLRNPTQSGEFYIILFPFWIMGVLLLFKKYKKTYITIIGYLLALLPAAMSGPPHAIRLTMLIPFALVTILFGYKYFLEYFKKFRWFSTTIIVLLFIFLGQFVLQYSVNTFATHEITSTYLSYAKKVAIIEGEYVKNGYTVYADHDLFPEPHIYYAYFNQIDPRITQESFAQVYEEEKGFSRPKQFGNNIFFDGRSIDNFNCEGAPDTPYVFITNDSKENITPDKIVKDNTGLYSFVYIYEVDDLCAK